MNDLRILASHPIQYQVPLFRELADRGVQIDVGYYHQGMAGKSALDVGFGIEVKWDIDLLGGYPYQIFLNTSATYRLLEQLRVAPKILLWSLRNQRTPLLLIGWFVELVWLVWLMRILLGVPVIVMGDNTPQSFGLFPKPAWKVAVLRWLLKHTSAVLFFGKRNRDFWRSVGVADERLFHTPYAVDVVRFAASAKHLMPQRDKVCTQFGLDPELPTFCFCGKLIPKKHPLELLEAYDSAGLGEKAQLIYVGDGILRPRLEQRIQELKLNHVHILGFMNQSQMPKAYILGEVLCLISDPSETWGLVVNEAMACSRPVLVSDAVGCAPDLVDETNGWVVPANDPVALARTLRQAYEERHTWEEKGRQSLKKISRYTYSAMADGVQAALQSLDPAGFPHKSSH